MYGLKVLRIAQDFKVIAPHERRPLSQGVQRLRATLVDAPLRIRWVVIVNLMVSMRQQIGMASAHERQTALLCAMSRELAVTRGVSSMARAAVLHVAESFRCQAVILLPGAAGKLGYPRDCALETSFRSADLGVAQWVADHGRLAGFGTDTFPAAPALYVPLGDPQERPGVLALLPTDARGVLIPGRRDLIQTFATQIGLAMDRARLAESAEAASLAAERESLRNTLLASISHDLRTPLAVIAAAGSTLVEHGRSLSENTRTMLARSIETKAREMAKLVSNVLDLTRFESGQLVLRRDWQSFDDLAGTAVRSLEDRLEAHLVELCIPPELPLIFVDGALIVQVLYNLLENASKYTPAGTRVCVSAVTDGECLRMSVDDDGPGLPPGDPARLFDKFQRGNVEGNGMGAGLGLAISRAIIVAHGGYIEAQRSERGGAKFDFTVPLEEFAS